MDERYHAERAALEAILEEADRTTQPQPGAGPDAVTYRACPLCSGTGGMPDDPCEPCEGSGNMHHR